ncbi:tetratricopeptide repeat protein [bacterium]|nr:tetratricopeptide repeat protein [bacterium]
MKKMTIIFVLIAFCALISGCGSVDKKENDEKNTNLRLLEENLGSKDAAFNEGQDFLAKKEYEKALESFKKSTVKDAEFYAAYSLDALKRSDEAKKAFETCVEKGIQPVESLYNLALISYDSQDVPSAKSYAEKVLKLDPKHIATLFFYGNLFFVEQNMNEALKYYKEAEKINPESSEIQNAIFLVYLQAEQYENAWKMRGKLDKESPEMVFAVMQIAEITGNFLDGANFAKEELLAENRIRNLAKILFTKGGDLIKALELAEVETIEAGKYSLLDRSTAQESAYVLALDSEKNIFVSCAANPGNLIPAEVSEEGIKVEGINQIISFKEVSAKLADFCKGK